MTVYVDVLFAINAVINYLMLRGSAAMGGCPASVRRLVTAALIGGGYAVAVVVPGLEHLRAVPFQLVAATVMVVVAFGWKGIAVRQGLFFLALSFAFGGAVLLAVQTVEPDCVILDGRAYYAVSTPALLLLAGLCYGLAAVVLKGWGSHTGGDLAELTLSLNGQAAKLRALRDTGNTLRDPITGETVLVADWEVLCKLLPDAALRKEECRDPASLVRRLAAQYPQLRFRLLTYQAVGVECGLLPAVGCTVTEKGRSRKILTAFTAARLSPDGRFEALMGGAIK
jgi:stage II sporulation protein GA (sporulation sigma-E factor processing peptidase)